MSPEQRLDGNSMRDQDRRAIVRILYRKALVNEVEHALAGHLLRFTARRAEVTASLKHLGLHFRILIERTRPVFPLAGTVLQQGFMRFKCGPACAKPALERLGGLQSSLSGGAGEQVGFELVLHPVQGAARHFGGGEVLTESLCLRFAKLGQRCLQRPSANQVRRGVHLGFGMPNQQEPQSGVRECLRFDGTSGVCHDQVLPVSGVRKNYRPAPDRSNRIDEARFIPHRISHMRVLGLDYGRRRIGLAMGDTETKVAGPWSVLEQTSLEKTLSNLSDLIRSEQVEAFVIGLPRPLQDQTRDSAQTEEVREFIKSLQSLGLPVYEQDETWSSRTAAQQMIERGEKGKRDDLAATIILQTWLDRSTHK